MASYVDENAEFMRLYLSDELELKFNPQGTLVERLIDRAEPYVRLVDERCGAASPDRPFVDLAAFSAGEGLQCGRSRPPLKKPECRLSGNRSTNGPFWDTINDGSEPKVSAMLPVHKYRS